MFSLIQTETLLAYTAAQVDRGLCRHGRNPPNDDVRRAGGNRHAHRLCEFGRWPNGRMAYTN
jgi:hypothetical protein